jgi:CRISPR-associated protein Csb2
MLTVEVELLHDTLRAGSASDLALTGEMDPGEWPPSPMRLLAALVAGDGTGSRCRVTSGDELRAIEAAPPPRIHADPVDRVFITQAIDRYVVVNDRAENAMQEYVARTGTLVRPSPRHAPYTPHVAYVWDELELDPAELAALQRRADRAGYLGCSDSPVRVRVTSRPPGPLVPSTIWDPHPSGEIVLPVPFDGLLKVLDRAFEEFQAGVAVRRSWYRTAYARYRAPGVRAASVEPEPAWLVVRFARAIPGRRVLAVTETLRAAVLDRYTRHVAGRPERVPAVVSGHGLDGTGQHHVRFLALPDVGHPHARGRIHGAGVWVPPDTDREVIEGLRTTLWHLRQLVKPGWFETAVQLHGGEERPWAARPERWVGIRGSGARRWVTVFPAVHERFTGRRGPGREEIERWCRNAGITVPVVAARSSRVPLLPGAPSLHPSEVQRGPGGTTHPYSHLELTFAEAVRGPLAVGRARHFGLGLLAPVADHDREGADA